MDDARIEDLAFDEVDLRVCLSWGQALSQGFVSWGQALSQGFVCVR